MTSVFWLCVGASGLFGGMPNTLYQIPVLVLLYPVALSVLGSGSANWQQALRTGWLCGLVGASACMYWVAIPVHEFGGLPWPLAAPCALFMGAYIGLYGGLFAALCQLTGKARLSPWRKALVLGLGWYLLEVFRGWFLTGFPWLSLASAFAPWPVFLQGASVVGMYGLGGLFVGLVCLCAQQGEGLAAEERGNLFVKLVRRPLIWGGLAGGLILVFGWWRMEAVHPVVPPSAQNFPVTLVQGNLDQNVKWEPSMQRLTVQRYLTLSTEALAFPDPETGQPGLLIWPETAMPFHYQSQKEFAPLIRDYAREHKVSVLFGAPGFRRKETPDSEKMEPDIFNRAYLVTSGEDSGWYEKAHLVPFGEYMPPYLDLPFLRPLLQGVGNFTPGERILPLEAVFLQAVVPAATPSGRPAERPSSTVDTSLSRNVPDKPLVLGVLICYETVFPELARQRVVDGAEVFVNISNDAWFGRSAAPEQHLQLTLLRAVEQGRWILRATNTGISAFIDPAGRVRARSALFKAQTLSARVPSLSAPTVFFYVGPWLPGVALVVFLWLSRGLAGTVVQVRSGIAQSKRHRFSTQAV